MIELQQNCLDVAIKLSSEQAEEYQLPFFTKEEWADMVERTLTYTVTHSWY